MLAPIELEPIKAGQEKLERVFGNAYAFSIPSYQRPYAWEAEHAQALLSDIVDAMDQALAAPKEPITYFLGSIVLIKAPGAPRSQVVDGQQRLTTLTILLAVLRDLSDASKQVSRHRFVCEAGDADTGAVERPRMTLRKKDAEYFRLNIQEMGSTGTDATPLARNGAQRCVAINCAFYRRKLSEWTPERRDALMRFLLQRCYLVIIAVENVDVAHRVFTVLNARGLDLTPTDILKADLLERAVDETEEEDLASRWEAMEEIVGRERFVELFQNVRMIFQKEKPRRRLDIDFPRVVPAFAHPSAFVRTLLEPIGDQYRLLMNRPAFEERYGEAAAKRLAHLQRLDNGDWLAPALRFLWNDGKPGVEHVELFMRKLETLAYFLFLSRADINARISRYAALIRDIEDASASPGAKGEPTWSGRSVALSHAEQTTMLAILDEDVYEKTRVRLPLLLRLDGEVSGKGATYATDVVTIEHVLPQNPEPNGDWTKTFAASDRAAWTHKLANLVLLDRRANSSARNWDFATKKARYFATRQGVSPFALTTGVIYAEDWTPARLEKRQTELKRALAKTWDIPFPPNDATPP
ncbi:DUF262 domain-containing protein [Aureimonas sp. ME7]|uniref:DUF262 domain-containing protein n=1 Tax=Aureimonas sp. ME7 TaxID=2744252 RepID=UPI0015F9AF32|nr:DUF262 domain-containing protein [Aureimonas sp. ME7]